MDGRFCVKLIFGEQALGDYNGSRVRTRGSLKGHSAYWSVIDRSEAHSGRVCHAGKKTASAEIRALAAHSLTGRLGGRSQPFSRNDP